MPGSSAFHNESAPVMAQKWDIPVTICHPSICFNEAAPVMAQKCHADGLRARGKERFNEAAPVMAQKFRYPHDVPGRSAGDASMRLRRLWRRNLNDIQDKDDTDSPLQ